MAIIFFNFLSIRLQNNLHTYLQNKYFRYFIPFLVIRNLKQTNIWMGVAFVLFSKTPLIE